MSYPSWAPEDVVAVHKGFTAAYKRLQSDLANPDDRDRLARQNGYRTAQDLDASMKLRVEAVGRLLTNARMREVWAWLDKCRDDAYEKTPIPHSANGGIIGTFCRHVENWFKTARLPASDRDATIRLIARQSNQLAKTMRKFEAEMSTLPRMSELLRGQVRSDAERYLHPDAITALTFGKRHEEIIAWMTEQGNDPKAIAEQSTQPMHPHPALVILEHLLPTCTRLVERLAETMKVRDSALPKRFPTKMNQENTALRTYVVNSITSHHVFLVIKPNYKHIATFVSVALPEEGEISPNLVLRLTQAAEQKRNSRSKNK